MSKLWKLVYVLVGILLLAAIFPVTRRWAEHFEETTPATTTPSTTPSTTTKPATTESKVDDCKLNNSNLGFGVKITPTTNIQSLITGDFVKTKCEGCKATLSNGKVTVNCTKCKKPDGKCTPGAWSKTVDVTPVNIEY